jgi:hypothetical protein
VKQIVLFIVLSLPLESSSIHYCFNLSSLVSCYKCSCGYRKSAIRKFGTSVVCRQAVSHVHTDCSVFSRCTVNNDSHKNFFFFQISAWFCTVLFSNSGTRVENPQRILTNLACSCSVYRCPFRQSTHTSWSLIDTLCPQMSLPPIHPPIMRFDLHCPQMSSADPPTHHDL